jgi:hypothetical protein
MKNEDKIMIFLGALVLAMAFYIAITYTDNLREQKAIELNKTIQNATMQGAYQIIAEQTATGRIYYFTNQSGNWTVTSNTLQELCGK